jgi:hypothetical protein
MNIGSRFAITVFLGLALRVQAVAEDANLTWGLVNGNAWSVMPEEARTYYISGYREAVRYMLDYNKSGRKKMTEYIPQGDINEMLNRFYSDPRNTLLPVSLAMHAIAQGMSGTSDKKLKLEDIRKLAAESHR